MTKRKAQAHWAGKASDGKGELTAASTVLNETPYSFQTRFENEDGKAGTNPEELIAAAHAGCFAMALSFALEQAGHTAEALNVDATVTLSKVEGGFDITKIHLDLEGSVPGISEEAFTKTAKEAKENCPVSKALKAVPVDLEIKFNS
ncbi:MAG TPA: OsmC family protein [Cyclobacteriaceae bacterium]